MRSRPPETKMTRLPIMAALLLVLFGRMLAPIGWMPAIAADGGLRLSICTGTGAVAMYLAADGTLSEAPPQDSGAAADESCAFAGSVPALAAAHPAASSVAFAYQRADPPRLRGGGAIGRGLSAPPPPQTGPPVRV